MTELADLQHYARFFITLLAVLDPFLAIPIYVGVTAQKSEESRLALARVVTLTVLAVLILKEDVRWRRWTGADSPTRCSTAVCNGWRSIVPACRTTSTGRSDRRPLDRDQFATGGGDAGDGFLVRDDRQQAVLPGVVAEDIGEAA